MTTLQIAVLSNYVALVAASLWLGYEHVRTHRRINAPGLLFVGMTILLETAEHALFFAANYYSNGARGGAAFTFVLLARSVTWLRLGLGWGLLLGARYALLPLSDVRGPLSATRLVWEGYVGGCRSLWCRLKKRLMNVKP